MVKSRMVKTRVGTRIKEVVNGKKSMNISADLTALKQRYGSLKKKLTRLINVLEKHHAIMKEISKSRIDVASQITSLTQGTPMFSCGGDMENHSQSYAAIHSDICSKGEDFADKYNQFVVLYVLEWENVVTKRVNAGLKTTESLRLDLDHYQRKVEELKLQVNKLLSKGKMPDEKTKDKLKRNEEKLSNAKQIHDKASQDMCMLLEETVDHGWKDLHPILIKMAQFDMTVANDEAREFSEMESVVTALKGLATSHGLNSAGRLKALLEEKVSILYTGNTHGHSAGAIGNGGNEGYDAGGMGQGGSYLSYENNAPSLPPGTVAPQGMGGYPVHVSEINNTPSMPPGSVAPQGMGGYPVQVSENNTPSLPPGSVAPQGMGGYPLQIKSEDTPSNNTVRASANSSNSNEYWNRPTPISTSDMLEVAQSAAPPPTLDEIDYANNNDQHLSAPNPYYPGPPVEPSSGQLTPSTNPFGPGNTNSYGPSTPSADGIKITAAPSAPPPPPPLYEPPSAPSYPTMSARDPPSGLHSSISPRGGSLTNPFDPPVGGVGRDPPSAPSPSTNPFGY